VPGENDLQQVVDFHQVGQVIYRYASAVDDADFATVRRLFADDARVKFGDHDEVVGADAIVAWIEAAMGDRAWQHHLVSVYHVAVDGDEAAALTYHTSHQTLKADPDTVVVIVARYHDRLRREEGAWRISAKTMEIGWRERRRRGD
jgi:3-phenylpropionate/cinnamic acid dioxygenase small subunit